MMEDDGKRLSERYGNLIDDNLNDNLLMDPSEPKIDGRWTGKVIWNNDPMRMGRVKVKIFGFYDDVDDAVIPWALPENGYLGASTSNLVVPPVDTIVRGYFENGDPYKPVYDGMITVENPLAAAAEAFIGIRAPGDSILDEAASSLDYPDVMVLMKTDDGEGVTLNRKNGQMKISHRSGLKIQIDPNGSILVEQSMSKKIVNPDAATMDVKIEGKFNLEANDDIVINAKKNVYIDAVKGDVNLGRNSLKTLVCAHPTCFVTDAPTNGGNTNVKA
jgi:hypothetical protein